MNHRRLGAATPAQIRVEIEPRRNTLAVIVTGLELEAGSGDTLVGTLDVGTGGRLIGLEVGDRYLNLSDPVRGAEHLTRSVNVPVTIANVPGERAIAIRFRRSGDHYEISFPSGNQCWKAGAAGSIGSARICSMVIT